MNRAARIILSLLVVLCTIARATTPEYLDSVKNVLKTSSNTQDQLNGLYTLSFEYGLIDPKKGIAYGEQCLKMALREKDLNYQLNAFNGIANAWETLGNFDSARYFHHKSYEVAVQMNSPGKMALTLVNVALCMKQQGDYQGALKQYLLAYKFFEKESSYNPRVHFYLGEMYLKLGDIDNAEYQSRLGIKKCREFNQNYIVYNLEVNLARCYLYKELPDSAIAILEPALTGLKSNTDKISIGICLSTLGEAYMQKKEYKKAFDFFSEELVLQQEIKNDNGIYLAGLNKAYCGALKKDISSLQIKEMLRTSENQFLYVKKNHDVLIEGFLKAALTYELIGEREGALRSYKAYYAAKDSLLNIQRLKQIGELQSEYELDKKENEILALKQSERIKDLEIRKRNFIILLGLFLFLLISVIVYFFIQKRKYKNRLDKERAIQLTEETERLRIAKDIHDDLGSGLSKISFLSELISRDKNLSAQSSESAEAISETSKKLVVNMKDLIWALNPENTTLSGLVSRIREHSSDYLEDYSAELKLNFPDSVESSPITKDSHRQILMTIKESLNNIVKHSQASLVEIETFVSDSIMLLTVKDNGRGFDTNERTGNGLGNMQARIESIGGTFSVESNVSVGTMIVLSIPIGKIKRS